jgi:hypothetical protein
MASIEYNQSLLHKFCHSSILPVVLLLVPSMVWILTDHHVWPWDQAWYGEVTVDLWANLVSAPSAWPHSMLHALGTKPPAVVWLGQFFCPFASVIGWEGALLLSVVFTNAISLVVLHSALTRLFGPGCLAAWIGSLSVASSPLFIALNHQYFAEPVQLLAVCLFLWIAVNRDNMSRLRLVGWLCAATALGLSVKTTTLIYVFGFGLLILTRLFRKQYVKPQGESPVATAALLITGMAFFTLTVSWYAINYINVVEHAIQSATGSVALDYGSAADLPTKLSFWLGSLENSLFLPNARIPVILIGGLLIAFNIYRFIDGRNRFQCTSEKLCASPHITIAAISQIVVVLLLFSITINEETRYLLPLFPSIAVMLASLIASANVRPLAYGFAIFFLLQWGFVCTFATVALPIPVGTPWLMMRQTDQDRHDTISNLAKLTCPRDNAWRNNVVGTEQPWLNANTLAFFSAQAKLDMGWRCLYTSLGYGETSSVRAWQRLNDSVKAVYIIMLDSDSTEVSPNFLNRTNDEVRHLVEASDVFTRVPFSSVEGIAVFKRIN